MKTSIQIGVLLFIVMIFPAYAQQSDSTRLMYSEEMDSVPAKQKSRFTRASYRRFIRAQIEEKTLIKFSALPTAIGVGSDGSASWGFRSEVAIEQKLTPALSLLLAGRTYYQHPPHTTEDVITINGVVAGRWYFNMLKRIRQQKSANNFSDQYLTIELNQRIWSGAVDLGVDPVYTIPSSIRLAIGAQRRLGRLAYLDAAFGVNYNHTSPRPLFTAITFLIGLGL